MITPMTLFRLGGELEPKGQEIPFTGASPNKAGNFQRSFLCPGALGRRTAELGEFVIEVRMPTMIDATFECKDVNWRRLKT